MRFTKRIGAIAVGTTWLCLMASGSLGQAQPKRVEIPTAATALEGLPTVRIDSTEGRTARRVLNATEAKSERLLISVRDGKFFWTSRDNRPLQLTPSGEFTYFASEPGSYIRLTRINDKITYVEHQDAALLPPSARPSLLPFGTVTWWGELTIVLKK